MAEVPFKPQSGVTLEEDLQKLCTALRRLDLDMGHEVGRFLASDTWRAPFSSVREFLDRLGAAHVEANALIDAYLALHLSGALLPEGTKLEPTDG